MSAANKRDVPPTVAAAQSALRIFGKTPQPILKQLARKAPVNAAGDTLAPEIAIALAAMNKIPGKDFIDVPVAEGREMIDAEAMLFADSFEPFAVEEDLLIPSKAGNIPATRYRHRAEFSRGLMVYFHGGGWVLGSRVSNDSAARFLAVEAGIDVLVVDYRLAPEHPFPAAIDDALVAWDFAVEQAEHWGFNPRQLVIGGDSAGGNIAAVVSQLIKDREVQPALQVLLFPVTDLSRTTASYEEFAEGYFLTAAHMEWYINHYLADPADATDPMASPLLAEDVSGVAPAFVAVAGFDVLRDEGIEYAKKLKRANVPTQLEREGELIHAFINITGVSPHARTATKKIARAIRDALVEPLRGLKD